MSRQRKAVPRGSQKTEPPKARVDDVQRSLAKVSRAVALAGAQAQATYQHALQTFGSDAKVSHWLLRANPLFDGETALTVLLTDPAKVEAELVRIDHGIYV